MNKQLVRYLACGLALAVSGCSIFHKESTAPDPSRPQVTVVADRFIVVNQEPLVFLKGQRNVTITWQLPKDSKFRFARNGITVDKAEGEIDCPPRGEGALEFSCLNRHAKPGKYSYTIRLVEGKNRLESDPYIMNE